jgi:integrase/recombinase XerD
MLFSTSDLCVKTGECDSVSSMLNLWRRHTKDCKFRAEGRDCVKCKCPIWVDWRVSGARIRKPIGLSDWQLAQQRARKWEAEGMEGVTAPQTIKAVCEAFREDAKARDLKPPTIYKYDLLFRQLEAFTEDKGLVFISDLGLEEARDFRASWPNKNMAARKKLEHFRAFLRFCQESDWIKSNPATKLKPPKVTSGPTLPFPRAEFESILAACENYPDQKNAVRLRALVLLLRYSGLRLGDGVTLERSRIEKDRLQLYTAKTGTHVYCPLPPVAIEALAACPKNGRYFFWTGNGKVKSTVGNWQRALKLLFKLAKVPTGHAHRFRDTFAVEMLLAGIPLERVSILLGHQSVKVTEKHYSPWVRERQEQIEDDVRRMWEVEKRGHVLGTRLKVVK